MPKWVSMIIYSSDQVKLQLRYLMLKLLPKILLMEDKRINPQHDDESKDLTQTMKNEKLQVKHLYYIILLVIV